MFICLVFLFLWIFTSKKNQISQLESDLETQKLKYEKLDEEYNACKGEIFHKGKLLDMQIKKYNRDLLLKDSL